MSLISNKPTDEAKQLINSKGLLVDPKDHLLGQHYVFQDSDCTKLRSSDSSVDLIPINTTSAASNTMFLSKDLAVLSNDGVLSQHIDDYSLFNSQDTFSSLFSNIELDTKPCVSSEKAARHVAGTPLSAEVLPEEDIDSVFESQETAFNSQEAISALLNNRDFDMKHYPGSSAASMFQPNKLFPPDLQAPQPHPVPSHDAEATENVDADVVSQERNSRKPSNAKPRKRAATQNKRKRKSRPRKKVVPAVYQYVEPTDHDVLLGRGGRSNNHPGNKRYREEVKNLQEWYKGTDDCDEKTNLSQCLVEYVHSYGGRFLEKDQKNGETRWYIVPSIIARRKASQALREDNDPAKRAAKRARHLAKKKKEAEKKG